MRTRLWLAVMVLAAALGVVMMWPKSDIEATPARTPKELPKAAPPKIAPQLANTPLAARLNADDGTAEEDVKTLLELVHIQLHQLRARPSPIGNDTDLAKVLTGHNRLNRAVLPPDHRAISPDGHLRDRWGTPYFIHPRASDAIEIRSAGPDKVLFTEDDVVANPGR